MVVPSFLTNEYIKQPECLQTTTLKIKTTLLKQEIQMISAGRESVQRGNNRTRAAKREAQKQYKEANQEVRKAIKHNKRESITFWQRKQNHKQINTGLKICTD